MITSAVNKPYENTIYVSDSVFITLSQTASTQAVDLLKRTIYGTSGPKYQHIGQDKKVKAIAGPYFFELYESKILVGTYCLSERLIHISSGETISFYGRYFAVDPAYGGKGYGSLLIKESMRYISQKVKAPFLTYVYVEETNSRSLSVFTKDNYIEVGILEALVFSRIYPKTDKRVSLIQESEKSTVRKLLEATYSKYTLLQFTHLYYENNYFVLKENNEVVAGVQANPVSWRIIDMPGVGGKIIMNFVPHLPVINRLLNPNKYQFIALEAVFVKPGHEAELFSLLESVLVHFELTSALIMLDINSPFHQMLKESGQLGVMNKLKKNVYTKVLLKSEGITLKDIKSEIRQPIYTSAFDYS